MSMQRSGSDDSLEAHTALLQWITQKGGHLHESVQIAKDERRGVHFQVREDWGRSIPKSTCIVKTPLSTTMSYFNTVDRRLHSDGPGEGAFSANGVLLPPAFIDAVGPGESTVFFVMGQYLQGSRGFWFPWIRTLPQPGSLMTPLYYEGTDLEWLEGTSLLPAREQKMATMKKRYEHGYGKLRDSGFGDAERYTWDLYLWATTIITSRAFSSKVLSGVIPDEELSKDNMSVLLPFMDILNHRPLAKVEWSAGKEDVAFLVLEDVPAGQEISNNYGPRNNEQLMMNYGFCFADNPCDYRIVSLRAPPGSPLHQAKAHQLRMHPELAKETDDGYYVFNISYPHFAPGMSLEHSIFSPALLNAISVLAANNRELETLEINEREIGIPSHYGNSRNLLAALGQVMIELITHIVKLRSTAQGLQQPENLKQTHGKIYRDSQVILSETALIISAWTLTRARQHGLSGDWQEAKSPLNSHMARIPEGKFSEEILSRIRERILERKSLLANCGELFSFNELFEMLQPEMQEPYRACTRTIFAETEKAIPVLRGNSESAFGFPMFLCLTAALYQAGSASPEKCWLPSRLSKWAGFLLDRYPPPRNDVASTLEDEDDEHLVSMFDRVFDGIRARNPALFSALGECIGGQESWLSPNWLRWAWMIVEQESVQVPDDPLKMLATSGQGQDSVMLSTTSYLYIPAEPETEI